MAEFILRVNERAFNNLGVQVNFDEQRYGELLEELADSAKSEVPNDWNPIVTLSPAAAWGMSGIRQAINYMGSAGSEIDPKVDYNTDTKTIEVKASQEPQSTNSLLLFGTRRWSSHLSGELKEYEERNYRLRHFRRGGLAVTTGAMAFAGFEVAQGGGALAGGMIGFTGGLATTVVDARRSPYRKTLRAFTKDQEVLAKYGHVVQYETI